MFAYCVQELHMSEAEAYLRIQAARLGRQFPLIVQLFGQGSLHLTAIKLLGPHLTPDNHVRVLEQARGKNKREIELLVAALAPKPDVPSQMRKLPEPVRVTRAPAPVAPEVPIAAPTSSATQAPHVRARSAASCCVTHAAPTQSLQARAHRRAGTA
jgi:hypothetical protein